MCWCVDVINAFGASFGAEVCPFCFFFLIFYLFFAFGASFGAEVCPFCFFFFDIVLIFCLWCQVRRWGVPPLLFFVCPFHLFVRVRVMRVCVCNVCVCVCNIGVRAGGLECGRLISTIAYNIFIYMYTHTHKHTHTHTHAFICIY